MEFQQSIMPLPEIDQQVGIDLGLLDAVILSTGEKVGNSRYFRKDEKRHAGYPWSFAQSSIMIGRRDSLE